ncbi:neuropathy target esterase sws-like [Daktulosphaira vitifoliae]|uniref:neuropathy target esterase sws-like n=1 Tax=Daktulosphaira vitifoliae TaxID=58002 RepID=UPI0021AABA78|nr:neuropathy target esterase sws-like [Daktulosphaira vitifoliae]
MILKFKAMEHPAKYLEEDIILKDGENTLPDFFFILQSIRIFGQFTKPIFFKLCQQTEIISVRAGMYLFKIGDLDENVFIIKDGLVTLNITLVDGSTTPLRLVKAGDSIISLLSFVDVLTGHTKPLQTISARAVYDSTIIRLPVASFLKVLKEYPSSLFQIIQISMVRLQRVTFTALYQHLGLSVESTQIDADVYEESFVNPTSGNNNFSSFSSPLSQLLEDSHPYPLYQNKKNSTSELFLLNTNKNNSTTKTSEWYLKIAIDMFVKKLELIDDKFLEEKIKIYYVSKNTHLMHENFYSEAALILLLNGSLSVSRKVDYDRLSSIHILSIKPGDIIGGLSFLTKEEGFLTFKTIESSVIAVLSKNELYAIVQSVPQIILPIANTVISQLSPFMRQVDFALDWLFVESGRAIYRQGEELDSIYILLSGRLRSVITHENGKKELIAEYGKGDIIGIVEISTLKFRSTTVLAVRDSELTKIPKGLFNAIKIRFPGVGSTIHNHLSHAILGTWKKNTVSKTLDTRPSRNNFSNIVIFPLFEEVPINSFTHELFNSLCLIGPTLRLNSEFIKNTLGSNIFEYSNEYRLSNWLAHQEDHYKIVLYQCDNMLSSWTQRCIRQADCILLVVVGDKPPNIGKYERELEYLTSRIQKELVLLHKEDVKLTNNTVAWLSIRNWISSHHHIRCPTNFFSELSTAHLKEIYQNNEVEVKINIHSDFSRLARWLTGTSVGLVLGGGGARGAAHMGMIKAIKEAGVPIDMVGGVSIGAFMGAILCSENDVEEMIRKSRLWAKTMTYWWRFLMDLTYPLTSLFTGRYFNFTLMSIFGDTQIEDLWLPYFTVTADITASEMRIHTHGSLWRYVRSSMSQSWYLPPLCDPIDGHLLLDGGYINNLPADVMRSLGAKYILAIDVGAQDNVNFTNYKDSLQGFWLLWKKINPFSKPIKVPSIADIHSRLAYVSCVRQLEVVKNSDYCQYIRPPIDKYTTLQFASFDEIKDVGYLHGKKYFLDLEVAGIIPIQKQ